MSKHLMMDQRVIRKGEAHSLHGTIYDLLPDNRAIVIWDNNVFETLFVEEITLLPRLGDDVLLTYRVLGSRGARMKTRGTVVACRYPYVDLQTVLKSIEVRRVEDVRVIHRSNDDEP